MNYLFCSVGRRGELLKNFRKSIPENSVMVAADNSRYAPALYLADKQYIVPRIDAPEYIDTILEICCKEHIDAVTTFIDPEIELLSKNRERFEELHVEVLAPYEETAHLCFDKYQMFCYLKARGINTVETWGSLDEFAVAYNSGAVHFPVFAETPEDAVCLAEKVLSAPKYSQLDNYFQREVYGKLRNTIETELK